jgi:hypothetical protein
MKGWGSMFENNGNAKYGAITFSEMKSTASNCSRFSFPMLLSEEYENKKAGEEK